MARSCLRSSTLGVGCYLPTVLHCCSTGRFDPVSLCIIAIPSAFLHPCEFVSFASETDRNANTLENERPEHAMGQVVVRVSDRVQILHERTFRDELTLGPGQLREACPLQRATITHPPDLIQRSALEEKSFEENILYNTQISAPHPDNISLRVSDVALGS